MKIYHYHPYTKQLIAVGIADPSPLESGIWLIPANATNVVPPDEVPSQTLHFVDGAWVYQDIPVPPAPEPVVPLIPTQISMRQARLVLLAEGHLSAVNAGVSAMSEAVQIEWEYATTVDRSSPLVATLATALGLNSAALDALFTAGAAL